MDTISINVTTDTILYLVLVTTIIGLIVALVHTSNKADNLEDENEKLAHNNVTLLLWNQEATRKINILKVVAHAKVEEVRMHYVHGEANNDHRRTDVNENTD